MNSIREAIKQIEVGWKSQKIRLVGTKLNKDEFELLKETLAAHSTIKSLEICLCEVEEDHVVDFARNMESFSLVGLQLVHLRFGDEAAVALATAVQECPIKKLDVSYNEIGVQGIKAIAEALLDCGLESLLLSRNSFGVEGTLRLAEVLCRGRTSLRTLDLSKNHIDDVGCTALARALPFTLLDTVFLDHNEIGHAGVVELCAALEQSPHVVSLCLGGNRLSDDSVVLLARTLGRTRLEKLSLNANEFSDAALQELAAAVRESPTLEILDLKQNRHLKEPGLQALFESVRTHRTMKRIMLDDTACSPGLRDRFQKRLDALHSDRSRLMVALCSIYVVPRVGQRSKLRLVSSDLMRNIAEMLV